MDIDQISGDKTVETETTMTAQVMYCAVLALFPYCRVGSEATNHGAGQSNLS